MKKLLLLLVLPLVFNACSSDDGEKDVSSIKLNEKHIQLNVGDTFRFTATYFPSDAIPPKYKWESSDTKIAKIDTSGLLNALSKGEIIIKVSTSVYPYISDTVSVKILPIKADSISIDPTANIYYDGSKCFTVRFYPEQAKGLDILWTSSNENIATVSTSGCVKVKGIGNATITATISGTTLSSSSKISINHRNPNGKSVQCIATTQSGARCKRMTTNLNARCWQH